MLASILLIEDDVTVESLLYHILRRRGFDVIPVYDGRQAIDFLQRAVPSDLVLLDLLLPYCDGFRVLKTLRQIPRWENVPVIVLTSQTQEHSVMRAFQCGADDYIVKPFQVEDLLLRVARLIKKNHAQVS
jgi:DNA-binding response OmpR family regulator